MNDVLYAKLEDALQGWIDEAQEVLGYYHPDLWLFSRRENKITPVDLIGKSYLKVGVTNFVFLTDRGLTLFFKLSKAGKMTAWIGGWGRNNVPETFMVLTMLLNKHGLLPENDLGAREVFSSQWLFKHGYDLEETVWAWVRENGNLIEEFSTVGTGE